MNRCQTTKQPLPHELAEDQFGDLDEQPLVGACWASGQLHEFLAVAGAVRVKFTVAADVSHVSRRTFPSFAGRDQRRLTSAAARRLLKGNPNILGSGVI